MASGRVDAEQQFSKPSNPQSRGGFARLPLPAPRLGPTFFQQLGKAAASARNTPIEVRNSRKRTSRPPRAPQRDGKASPRSPGNHPKDPEGTPRELQRAQKNMLEIPRTNLEPLFQIYKKHYVFHCLEPWCSSGAPQERPRDPHNGPSMALWCPESDGDPTEIHRRPP